MQMDAENGPPLSPYRSIKRRLVAGEFKAGEKLRPDTLKDEYGISASAMREVFLHLTHDKLLVQEEQRGFHVTPASEERLMELMELRILLESEGVRLSIEHGGIEWEMRLTAAHHKLAHVETRMRDASNLKEFMTIWTRLDREFHETLLSGCQSESLRTTYRSIFEQYRQQVVSLNETAGFREAIVPEHEAILKAALDHDLEKCKAVIRSHLYAFRTEFIETLSSASREKLRAIG